MSTSRGAGAPETIEAAAAVQRAQRTHGLTPTGPANPEIRHPVSRLGVLWSPDWLAGPTAPFKASGARVAGATWVQAVSTSIRFQGVDVFAPLGTMEQSRQQLGGVLRGAPGPGCASVQLLPEPDIPEYLGRLDYDVLHSTGTDLCRPTYIRSRFSRRLFPVTCSQYGISYSFDVYPCFVALLTAQIYPCDAIVCLTEASKSAMSKRMADIAERYSRAWAQPPPPAPRLELIPFGVDTRMFSPRDQALARRDLGLPLDRPVLLSVGRIRLEDKMDLTPLLLAFADLRRSLDQPPLLVVAGADFSDYGAAIVAQAARLGLAGDVRTFFNLPPACLPSLYSACDVFVAPTDSASESFGLTIIEAMACGRPVVASDWDGYKETIVEGETGFKIRTDWADCLGEVSELAPVLPWQQVHLHLSQSVSVDVPQMSNALKVLFANQELREEMGRRGRARAEALYCWPTVLSQWDKLWTELMAAARGLDRDERDRMDYLSSDYFAHFSHYASRVVQDDTPVRLTPRGSEYLTRGIDVGPHPDAAGFLRMHHLLAMLSALRSVGRLRMGLSAGELVEVMGKVHRLSRQRSLMHLMWLAKYDMVALGSASRRGSRSDEDERSG